MLYTCAVLPFLPLSQRERRTGKIAASRRFCERIGTVATRRSNLPPSAAPWQPSAGKNVFPLCSPKAVEIPPNPFPSVPPPNHVDSHTALFPVTCKRALSRRRPIGCFKRPKGLCANGGSPFPAPVHTAFLRGGQRPSPQHRPAILRREAAFKHVLLYFLQFSPDCALFLAICLQFFDKIAMIWVSEHIDRSEEKSL